MVFKIHLDTTMCFACIQNPLYTGTVLLNQPDIFEKFGQPWIARTGYVVVGKDVPDSQARGQSAGIGELDMVVEYLYRVYYAGVSIVAMTIMFNTISRIASTG